ncbi:hypothetical protein ES708_30367 [subsurface metagenome]
MKLPETIGKGYCVAFCEEIHIDKSGKCISYNKKGIKLKGNPEFKKEYDKALNELINP